MIVMKNWSIFTNQDGYTPPELVRYKLQGNVYGHPRFEDGFQVHTSRIVDIIDKGYCKIVKTKNTEYAVFRDDVNKEYEKEFPNVYERLSVTYV